jgi:hypothetical protein
MMTFPAVPSLLNVRVVELAIWPDTCPSAGFVVFSLMLKTRKARVVSIAGVSVTAAAGVLAPFAIVVVPDWRFRRTAA